MDVKWRTSWLMGWLAWRIRYQYKQAELARNQTATRQVALEPRLCPLVGAYGPLLVQATAINLKCRVTRLQLVVIMRANSKLRRPSTRS